MLVERAGAAIDGAGEPIFEGEGAPRFELFHAANSICSQKVRSVLAHCRLPYVSHGMNLFAGQTYLPDYVRLRMVGCEAHDGPLVAHHSGSTSASQGCDGVVVPTLVDRETGAVIVDSKRICLHLDALLPDEQRLRPQALAASIDREIDIVDHVPNYQLLMGRQADAQGGAAAFSERKVAWCDHYLARCSGETALVEAYAAKRAKELSAACELFSAQAMERAYKSVEDALSALEAKLADRDAAWLLGKAPTMADLFWGIQLLRIENLGLAWFWVGARLPAVDSFIAQVRALPAIRSAILEWPGALH